MSAFVLGLLVVCSAAWIIEGRDVSYCFAEDLEPYLAYATKTSYEYINSQSSSIRDVVGCKPVQIWGLFRHGTRYPGSEEIERYKGLETIRDQIMMNHYDRKDGHLCDKDLENLKTWRFTLTSSDADLLAPQGYSDFLFLAKRMKTQFPDILGTSYSADKFVFRHSETERTAKSASSFAEGLFGKDAGVVIPNGSGEEEMSLIRTYSNCSTWESRSIELLKESMKFEETEIMKILRYNVSNRLGFKYNLTASMIGSFYDVCRFDKAWNFTATSPWCAAFTIDELKVLEYFEDLRYYYKSGYGNDQNLILACPLLKDLYEKFSKTASNYSDTTNPKGTFYFSHASMVNMFSARLGLYKDSTPLTYSNYESMSKRNYRTTDIMPFASNIAAVFYKCTNGEENQVMFYHNEKPVLYDGCNVGLCSWKTIKDKFSAAVDPSTCNLKFCNPGNGGVVLQPVVALILAIILFLFKL
uniref:Multiple inositol polyphosphate phosphatase 1 n=2 Tax=Clastoptera arizonana TaxID=38151 RepID=A0A1B6DXK1_9HEMI